MVVAKPDCTGQRFGYITVLGKGELICRNGKSRQLWRLQCDCGTVIELPRIDFEKERGQKSCGKKECGCRRQLKTTSRNLIDITNQRFGNLTAIKLSGNKDKYNQPLWLMQCDCGNTVERSHKKLNHSIAVGIRNNCKDVSKHPEHWLVYPPTPSPYPQEAGTLLEKYLYLTELKYQKVNSAVEDELRDRLIRACWIVTYRRQMGEEISELKEKRLIKKHLRYASVDVFRHHLLEKHGGLYYDRFNNKHELGNSMTNVTYSSYPKLEMPGGINTLSENKEAPVKRVKFKRC